MGPHLETFFGVHPYIVEQGLQEQVAYDNAVKGFTINNSGTTDLILFKIFGPDIDNPPFKIV